MNRGYSRPIGTSAPSRAHDEQGGDPMTNAPFVDVGDLQALDSSTPLFWGGRSARRAVQIRLDRHCEGVIRSSERRMGWGCHSIGH